MISIRAASTDDLALLATLNAIVHDAHVHHRPDLFVSAPSREALEALLVSRLSDPHVTFLIAETPGGDALGYAMARFVIRHGSALTLPDSYISVQQIAVAPSASRSGVGSALLNEVRELGRAAGCRRLVTDVWDFNEGARAFYEASGLRCMNRTLDQEL
ncbi:GNAT family N-acetyltransferase [Streptomyces caniferus]|uniref:GNAT family N-acetyltransferase n=1 Tax=Streptomyces caniferus TaxID=285557 RepID=UPI0037145C5A